MPHPDMIPNPSAHPSSVNPKAIPPKAVSRQSRNAATTVKEIYRILVQRYGWQMWWPAATPFEMMVGAILTQATSWTNVEQAIRRLEQRECLTPVAIHRLPTGELEQLVRPSGYFRMKARKLKALAHHVVQEHNGSVEHLLRTPMEKLRGELLSIYGIGPETADSILLYAAGYPIFVIDAYTLRAGSRLGLFPTTAKYNEAQAFFQRALPRRARLFNEFHALWVELGKDLCRPKPLCHLCPLAKLCPTGGKGKAQSRLEKPEKTEGTVR